MEIYEKDVVKEIVPDKLKKIIAAGNNFQLIDVREPSEHEVINIGGELIPFDELLYGVDRIAHDKPVIVYCKVGLRSHIAIQRLQEKHGFKNLYNLKGGITAYLEP
ncbi:MAG: rhodanese-like domain-containing protein [Chitinophagales bacterium]